MDIDEPTLDPSDIQTSTSAAIFFSSLPKIDENSTPDKPVKERLLKCLDLLESRVEKLRKQAYQLEEDRDHVLASLDYVRHADHMNQLQQNDVEDILCYADRIMNRCQTVEVCVMTQRDQLQEEALFQVNHLIDGLVMDLKNDHEIAKQRCLAYVNTCSSMMVEGVMDKSFENVLLGCTVDDQKRVKKRLQGLLNYVEKLGIQSFD